MSSVKTVVLPQLGVVHLIIKTKREIRAHPAVVQMEDESDEWLYWNRVWHSEVALSEWLIDEFYPDKLVGKTVLELGCGTGLAGIVVAKLGGVTTFSDKIPMVMETVKETCELNKIENYRTLLLDWSDPEAMSDSYDMALGSEIFYDARFLQDICEVLKRALVSKGRAVFCDPNRLGIDSLEECFSKDFRMKVSPRLVSWPRQNGETQSPLKEVFLYQMMKKGKHGLDTKQRVKGNAKK